MADAETLGVYREKAGDYAKMVSGEGSNRHLDRFLALLPAGGKVLDLGCGVGNASAAMKKAGFQVDAWDASPEMAAIAGDRFGLDVEIRTFDTLDAEATYDGVYANFSLLHSPKSEMPGHISRIAQALKPGGILHIGLKTGEGERRDGLGRFYAYYSEAEISGLLAAEKITAVKFSTGEEAGLDGSVAPWIILTCRIGE